jgi:hypothetical protein
MPWTLCRNHTFSLFPWSNQRWLTLSSSSAYTSPTVWPELLQGSSLVWLIKWNLPCTWPRPTHNFTFQATKKKLWFWPLNIRVFRDDRRHSAWFWPLNIRVFRDDRRHSAWFFSTSAGKFAGSLSRRQQTGLQKSCNHSNSSKAQSTHTGLRNKLSQARSFSHFFDSDFPGQQRQLQWKQNRTRQSRLPRSSWLTSRQYKSHRRITAF